MLWYKAWLETRSRFLASLCGITAVVVLIVHHSQDVMQPVGLSGARYLLAPQRNTGDILNASQHVLMAIWVLAVILLGMGGLIRERAVGASSFTLALPVSRRRLVSVQIAIGVLESIGLAVLPWVAILVTLGLGGLPLSFSQVAFYLALLISGGLTYFALAVRERKTASRSVSVARRFRRTVGRGAPALGVRRSHPKAGILASTTQVQADQSEATSRPLPRSIRTPCGRLHNRGVAAIPKSVPHFGRGHSRGWSSYPRSPRSDRAHLIVGV